MLPYLKPKPTAGLIISQRKRDGGQEDPHTDGQEDAGLMAAAEDLIRAVHSKDATQVASAIKAAFEILESQPHEEASAESDESNEI